MQTFTGFSVLSTPSSENNDLIPSLLEEVCHIAREHNAFLIVCGDLNMPHINWVDGTTTGGID